VTGQEALAALAGKSGNVRRTAITEPEAEDLGFAFPSGYVYGCLSPVYLSCLTGVEFQGYVSLSTFRMEFCNQFSYCGGGSGEAVFFYQALVDPFGSMALF